MTESAREFIGPATFEALTGRPVPQRQFDDPHLSAGSAHRTGPPRGSCCASRPATANFLAKAATGTGRRSAQHAVSWLSRAGACGAGDELRNVGQAGRAAQREAAAQPTACTSSIPRKAGSVAATSAWGGWRRRRKFWRRSKHALAKVTRAMRRASGRGAVELIVARILITSGPTRQYLDPVRYLTNASSGRMGQALAAGGDRAPATSDHRHRAG